MSIAVRNERTWLCRALGLVLVAFAGSIVGLRSSVRAWDTTLHPGATMCLLEDGAQAQCGLWVEESLEVRPHYHPATVPDPGDAAHLARSAVRVVRGLVVSVMRRALSPLSTIPTIPTRCPNHPTIPTIPTIPNPLAPPALLQVNNGGDLGIVLTDWHLGPRQITGPKPWIEVYGNATCPEDRGLCMGYRWFGARYGECSSGWWDETATASSAMLLFETCMYFLIPTAVGLVSYGLHCLLTRFMFDDALITALLGTFQVSSLIKS